MNTDDLLNERQKTHGEYADHAYATQQTLRLWSSFGNWNILSDCQKETLHMIAHKVGRILTGNPDINDHWDDIAGYSRLISQRLPGAASSRPIANPGELTSPFTPFAAWGGGGSLQPGSKIVVVDEPNRPGTPEDGGHYARDPENN